MGTPTADERRDQALVQFREATAIDPRWDRAVQFAVSAAVGVRDLHAKRVEANRIKNKGMARTPLAPSVPVGMEGWKFGLAITKEMASYLGGGSVKAGAAAMSEELFGALEAGGALPPSRKGYHSDPAERRFAILITYFWRHIGRPGLTARHLYDLAFGVGIAPFLEDPKGAWGRHQRAAKRILSTFDPREPPPKKMSRVQVAHLVDLYAVIADMAYHPRLGREVRERPDHRALVDHAIRTQPKFDAVAFGRGVVQRP